MRAGLLSDPKVIHRLNEDFVCTSIIIDDLQKRADAGDEYAKRLAKAWNYPVVANGRLYLRDLNMLWCYDVKEARAAR